MSSGHLSYFHPLPYDLTAKEQAENDRFAPETVAGALMAMVSSSHAPAYIADIGKGRPQKTFETMTPDEKLLVTAFIKAQQELAAIKAELVDFERQIEELEDRRLREMLWLPWPMYIR